MQKISVLNKMIVQKGQETNNTQKTVWTDWLNLFNQTG